jgi:glycosyltransferase involved in cell wall biosynthesis
MPSPSKHAGLAGSRAPTVSVILATFNRLHYLRSTIASVFAQSFQDWELIIADDGSGEETRAYLQTLADLPRVRLIWLPHTGKPAVARNAALRAAQGEYLAFVDSDDLWLSQKLEIQIASLRRRAACGWSQTAFVLIDAGGSVIKAMPPVADGWILEKLMKAETSVHLTSVIATRALVERVGGFDEELATCEDYDLWWRLAAQTEIDGIEKPLTLVRRHDEHYSDDITCLEDLRRMLEKVWRSRSASHLDAVLQERRAKVAAALARGHALCRSPLRVLGTLLASAHYSWPYGKWWSGALKATAQAFAPQGVLSVMRKYRSPGRAKTGAQA